MKANDELTRAIQAKLSEKKSNGTKGTDVELTDATQTKLFEKELSKLKCRPTVAVTVPT